MVMMRYLRTKPSWVKLLGCTKCRSSAQLNSLTPFRKFTLHRSDHTIRMLEETVLHLTSSGNLVIPYLCWCWSDASSDHPVVSALSHFIFLDKTTTTINSSPRGLGNTFEFCTYFNMTCVPWKIFYISFACHNHNYGRSKYFYSL